MVLSTWVAPQAAASAVMLHVALGHGHTGHALPADAAVHGHLHGEGVPEHSHEVTVSDLTITRLLPRSFDLPAGSLVPTPSYGPSGVTLASPNAPGPAPPERPLPLRI